MRDGYRIIDTDTHVGPTADVLYEFGSDELLSRRDELKPYEREFRDGIGLSISPYPYKRKMGEPAFAEEAEKGGTPALKGAVGNNRVELPEPDVQQRNAEGRLRDMDREGRDIDLIIPGTFATAITAIDQSLAKELYASYGRYIVDYCSADPSRLKATIPVPASDPEWAAAQIASLGNETCVAAATVVLPEGVPVDDPSLHPIWAAMGDHDLPLLHHSFFYEPPYFPGYRDVWGQVAMARAAAHPWGAQRLLGYIILSGLLDQFPNLRVGFAECSGGWLPSWIVRLEGQADYLARSLPTISRSPRGYVEDGRIFCGVELYEGEETVHSIMAVLGDDSIMYQSDYPHDQCAFPKSPDTVLGWSGLGESTMTKLLSANAERYMRLL
ncbi:MAG: amidohydrolase family protein [Ilumatobacteraceae bacterium]